MSVEDATGFWRVVARTGKGDCLVSLNRLPHGEAFGVHLEACSLAPFDRVAAWRLVDGALELLDRDHGVVLRFARTGVDAFVSSDDTYRLERAPLA